jgi:hypothetical protein
MERLKPTVNVLETPLPQVNSEWDTPQLPLLELSVKPEPEATYHHISFRAIKVSREIITIGGSGISRTSTAFVPCHLRDKASLMTTRGICLKVTFPAEHTCSI